MKAKNTYTIEIPPGEVQNTMRIKPVDTEKAVIMPLTSDLETVGRLSLGDKLDLGKKVEDTVYLTLLTPSEKLTSITFDVIEFHGSQ